jgi:hypothetical protein
VFKEITRVPLNDSLVELELPGHYSQYRWGILSSPRTVCVLMLTRVLVSLATMVSGLVSPLLAVGSDGQAMVIFLIWLLMLTLGPTTIFSMKHASLKYYSP